jgi:hypothetical protein
VSNEISNDVICVLSLSLSLFTCILSPLRRLQPAPTFSHSYNKQTKRKGVGAKCQYDSHCIEKAFCRHQLVCFCKREHWMVTEDNWRCHGGFLIHSSLLTSSNAFLTLAQICTTHCTRLGVFFLLLFEPNFCKKINIQVLHCPGIEPGSSAWQANILPLNQQCL